MNAEMEKLKREASIKQETQKLVEQDLEALKCESDMLRERLMVLESEKANLLNEKERKDRECKHLQNEVYRINSMVNVSSCNLINFI